MYIVDDKNFNFYDRIFNVLDGRGIIVYLFQRSKWMKSRNRLIRLSLM